MTHQPTPNALEQPTEEQIRAEWQKFVCDMLMVANLTQTVLAERLGCDRAIVSHWTRGTRVPNAEWRDKLVLVAHEMDLLEECEETEQKLKSILENQ